MPKKKIFWATLVAVCGAVAVAVVLFLKEPTGRADPNDSRQVALGRSVYDANCAFCHGKQLEGQPDWQIRKLNGRLPAPPHDAGGHTWHHPDGHLFGIVKDGIAAYAPPGYESDMPAFGAALDDEQIWAVLAFIKSNWTENIRRLQERRTEAADK